LNHCLVEQGWAFPAHYNSMQIGEIYASNTLWATARNGFIKSIVHRANAIMAH